MSALSKIRKEGFSVTLVDGLIGLAPKEKLSDEQRSYLKEHKAAIIEELQRETSELDLWVDCFTPNGDLLRVKADSPEHALWLARVNPRPKVTHEAQDLP
ncbi:hypothetical protein GO003_004875 [Methylicorpusculum oleiharenae]|uniref:hypothetical protein n=1 Tax=Methylicorpusculum oleiharenae TaxID=1338687 RepID=UPI001359114A|nr:hypothetical protein [Methylicorpusculum oleiharenae]MCD2449722.1 hypothetical protein [Methylicorpusculum oleiharenae]